MPITILYTEDSIGVNFYAVDEVTGQDIIAGMELIFRNENFRNLRYWIIDRSLCTRYNVSSDEVMLIAELDKEAAKINPDLLHAMISETDLQYGISRMYEIHTDGAGFKTALFRDRAAAEKWIQEELNKA